MAEPHPRIPAGWPRMVNLRRCARGTITDAGEATNTTVALTNNSLGPELILVWQLVAVNPTEDTLGISYQRISPMTNPGVMQPIVPGDAMPPGLLTSGDQPNSFPSDWSILAEFSPYYWPATFPFAVLQPGWSLVIQNPLSPTDTLGMSFFWEAQLSKYFDHVHSYTQFELDIIASST